jgi:hypothetical protein
LVYALVSHGRHAPDVIIDEILYGQMAQGVASGAGTTWRGQGLGLHSLYPYLIAPGWKLGGGPVGGYEAARLIGLFAASLTAIPTWLISREIVQDWRRWIAPVAVLAGSWMVFTARLLAENLALPLATGSLAALTISLSRGRSRGWLAASIALALLATGTRIQLAVLLAVIPTALVLDLLRDPHSRLRRASAEIIPAEPQSAAIFGLPIVASLLGRYGGVFDSMPSVGELMYWFINNLVELTLMTGIVPVIALIGLALKRDNWTDQRVGAFLAVTIPAAALFLAELAWFNAAHAERPIDRYLVYLTPLLFVALAAAPGRIRMLHAAAASALIAMLVVVVPGPSGSESDAISAWAARTFPWDGFHPSATLVPLAVIVFVIGAGGAALLAGSVGATARKARNLTIGVCALVALQLVVGSQWSWHFSEARAANVAALMPQQRDWIDRSGHGDVAILEYAPVFSDIAYVNEFFNDRVVRAYKLDPQKSDLGGNGAYCVAHVGRGGAISVASGCEAVPSDLLAAGRGGSITFQNTASQITPPGKQISLVRTDGPPRVSTIATIGCGMQVACLKFGEIRLFDVPAEKLTFTLEAGSVSSRITANGTAVPLKPRQTRTLEIPIAAGDSTITLTADTAKSQKRATKVTRIELGGKMIYSAAVNEPEASRVASATSTKQ